MSDDTTRGTSSGGDTIRAIDVTTSKIQAMDLLVSRAGQEMGRASRAYPVPTRDAQLWEDVAKAFARRGELMRALAERRTVRRKGGAAKPERQYAGGFSFNPLLVANTCAVWYDLTHATIVAGKVTAIPDRSGNGRNAALSGAGLVYTPANAGYGGRPTVNRAEATDFIQIATPGLDANPFTVVLVGDAPAHASTENYVWRDGSGLLFLARQFAGAWQASGDGGTTVLNGPAGAASPTVLIIVRNGASSSTYASAVTPVSGDTGACDMTGQSLYVGNFANESLGDMNFTHAIVYAGAMSSTDAAYLLRGLGAESGIAIGP